MWVCARVFVVILHAPRKFSAQLFSFPLWPVWLYRVFAHYHFTARFFFLGGGGFILNITRAF